jgi:hypothetical protein
MGCDLKKDIRLVLKNTTSLAELEQISKKATQNITFCGYRYLAFSGYKGTTSLYKIQEKLNFILDNNPAKSDPAKITEKNHTLAIRRIILELGVENFERKTNIITRIMLIIRDFFRKWTAAGNEVHYILKKNLLKQQEDKFLENVRIQVRDQIIQEVRNEVRRELREPREGEIRLRVPSNQESPRFANRNADSPIPSTSEDIAPGLKVLSDVSS